MDPLALGGGTVVLTGDDLYIEEVVRVARRGARVAVSREALDRVRRAREVVEHVLERGDPVYGMNTGVGSLSRYRSSIWSSSPPRSSAGTRPTRGPRSARRSCGP